MTARELLGRMFNHEDWSNRQLLPCLADPAAPADALRKFAHLLSAKALWFERLGSAHGIEWDAHESWTVDDCRAHCEKLAELTVNFLAAADSNTMERRYAYTNTRGEDHVSTLADILAQLVLHARHHQAQITSLLRAAGIDAPDTDYILYLRQL